MKRKRLEVPIEFYSVEGTNSYDGATQTPLGEPMSCLVAFGGTPYNPEVDGDSLTVQPTEGDRFGSIRVFLKAVPAGLKYGDVFYLPTMANRPFQINGMDIRGTLPGKYPMRLQGEGI